MSFQPTSARPCGVCSRRLMPALPSGQLRGRSSATWVAARYSMSSTPPWQTSATQRPAKAAATRSTVARQRACSCSRLSPPAGVKVGSRSRRPRACAGQRASISAWVRPSRLPKQRSRRPGSATSGRPSGPASAAAVCQARCRSLDTTAARPSPASAPASAAAWARPKAFSAMSWWPCSRPNAFQAVSPWRMTTRRVVSIKACAAGGSGCRCPTAWPHPAHGRPAPRAPGRR